jgi:hypothetical protein
MGSSSVPYRRVSGTQIRRGGSTGPSGRRYRGSIGPKGAQMQVDSAIRRPMVMKPSSAKY